MQDRDARVRLTTIALLSNVGLPSAAIAPLQQCLRDRDSKVRERAKCFLLTFRATL
ncbi:hypothetical protein JYK05_12945 [Caballeronia sp. M1242]|nr:hypothetical protein JYK05_12945 [Caballeronia sp. M1242]